MYPSNTTCTYILDGLQGDQYLEKVILNFETFLLSDENNGFINLSKIASSDKSDSSLFDDCSIGSFVAVALTPESTHAVLSPTEESIYNVILCGQLKNGSKELGPYTSIGPRIVVVFGSADFNQNNNSIKKNKYGFRAKIDFKTGYN